MLERDHLMREFKKLSIVLAKLLRLQYANDEELFLAQLSEIAREELGIALEDIRRIKNIDELKKATAHFSGEQQIAMAHIFEHLFYESQGDGHQTDFDAQDATAGKALFFFLSYLRQSEELNMDLIHKVKNLSNHLGSDLDLGDLNTDLTKWKTLF